MASSQDFIEFVCSQIQDTGIVRYRKMFGEYMVYVNDKPILLVCDNTVYVKKLECIQGFLKDAEMGFPYTGAKEQYILDIDDEDLCYSVVTALEAVTKVPVKKIRKSKKQK